MAIEVPALGRREACGDPSLGKIDGEREGLRPSAERDGPAVQGIDGKRMAPAGLGEVERDPAVAVEAADEVAPATVAARAQEDRPVRHLRPGRHAGREQGRRGQGTQEAAAVSRHRGH